MADAVDLIKIVKRAALDAVTASKPTDICFGRVISANPLKIQVDQKMILEKEQLVLMRNVTDYTVAMSVDHYTESTQGHIHEMPDGTFSGTAGEHKHSYKGKKSFTVHNGLVVGDAVILLRAQGGQKYIVVDRIA